jgi:uncharacterized membrane protein
MTNISSANQKRAAKKAAIMKSSKRNALPYVIFALGLVAAAGVGVYHFTDKGPAIAPIQVAQVDDAMATQISYPVTQFADGFARHFDYQVDDHTMRYFVLKSSDGVIRAAFDACDVCWPAGKGYYQEGDHMVCRNCGRRFASVLVNEVQGGCNPAPLQRTIEDDQLVIKRADLLEGRRYFDFANKGTS